MIILFQILFGLVALSALISIHKRRAKQQFTASESMFWIMFWIAGAVVVFWPDSAARLASIFGIGRGVDFILYVSVAALFYLLFRLHLKMEMLNRDITRVTRKKALDEVESQDHTEV